MATVRKLEDFAELLDAELLNYLPEELATKERCQLGIPVLELPNWNAEDCTEEEYHNYCRTTVEEWEHWTLYKFAQEFHTATTMGYNPRKLQIWFYAQNKLGTIRFSDFSGPHLNAEKLYEQFKLFAS